MLRPLGLDWNQISASPGSPVCIWQIMGLLSLHHCISQSLIISFYISVYNISIYSIGSVFPGESWLINTQLSQTEWSPFCSPHPCTSHCSWTDWLSCQPEASLEWIHSWNGSVVLMLNNHWPSLCLLMATYCGPDGLHRWLFNLINFQWGNHFDAWIYCFIWTSQAFSASRHPAPKHGYSKKEYFSAFRESRFDNSRLS